MVAAAREGARFVLVGALSGQLAAHGTGRPAGAELDYFQNLLKEFTLRGYSADDGPEARPEGIERFGDWPRTGAIGRPEPGGHPVAGAAYGTAAGVAYAGYLFLMRLGGGRAHTATPVCVATAAAAVTAGVLGGLWTGVDLNRGWPAWGWLVTLALVGQVLAWLLIAAALPRLAPIVGAALLLLQPVIAFGLGIAIGERPTPAQAAGCALVVAAVWHGSRPPRTRAAGRRAG
ncbi:EamA family transporter [Streptomyces sp. GS7]|uniref:EamA family transporter n=1 Tax=Streptomyces sp. GS7 TaxID=2692234 RepID=UPI001F3FA292|nr:DMT family transporter [Streptomyces sp. GS7]